MQKDRKYARWKVSQGVNNLKVDRTARWHRNAKSIERQKHRKAERQDERIAIPSWKVFQGGKKGQAESIARRKDHTVEVESIARWMITTRRKLLQGGGNVSRSGKTTTRESIARWKLARRRK